MSIEFGKATMGTDMMKEVSKTVGYLDGTEEVQKGYQLSELKVIMEIALA